MSQLGNFLARLFGSAAPFETVHAVVRHRRRAQSSRHVGHRDPIGRVKPPDPIEPDKPEFQEYHRTFWAALPDRMRMEVVRMPADGTEPSESGRPALEIVNGRRAWERDERGRVETQELDDARIAAGGGFATEFQRHFDGGLLRQCVACLALEELGDGEIAGRNCTRLRAVPRPGCQLWPHWLAWAADEYLFHADTERPVLLAITAFAGGVVTESHEVTDITFDQSVDPSLFTYAPSESETVRPATPIAEQLALDVAAALVPFTVLIPSLEPRSRWRPTDVMYHAERPGRWHEHLTLSFPRDHRSRSWIHEAGQPEARQDDDLIWETVDLGPLQVQLSDPEGDAGMRVLRFVQEGTHVSIFSDLPKEQLFELAMSFVPFPKSADVQ